MAGAKTKKVTVRRGKNKIAVGPLFDHADSLSGKEFHHLRQSAVRFYYTEFKSSDLLKDLYAWMKKTGKYTAEQISDLKSRNTQTLSTIAIYARCLMAGMPDYHKEHAEYWEALPGTTGKVRPVSDTLHELINKALSTLRDEASSEDDTEEVVVDTPQKKTIQDHIREKSFEISGELLGFVDEYIADGCKKPSDTPVIDQLRSQNVTPQMIRIISEGFEDLLAEFREVATSDDAQLKEGYTHFGKIQVRNLIKFLELAIQDCEKYIQVKKAERKPRAKKAVSPQKLVAKFKYQKEDTTLNVKSEHPIKLIEANEAWLYNTKTRKLVHVVPDEYSKVLTIKGASIVGFDPAKTTQKTLRKPADQIKELLKASKPNARKFYNDIKAVDIKFNGRSNENLIILRVG